MNHWVADWAAWWETSILSGTTECAQASPSSLCWCPGLARTCSLPAQRKQGCGLQPVCAVADMSQRHVLIKNTSAEMGGTQKHDDATLLDEMQPEALLHKTTGCARVTSTSYQLYRYKYHGIGSNSWLLKWYIFIESHLLALGAILRPLAVTARNATEPPQKMWSDEHSVLIQVCSCWLQLTGALQHLHQFYRYLTHYLVHAILVLDVFWQFFTKWHKH